MPMSTTGDQQRRLDGVAAYHEADHGALYSHHRRRFEHVSIAPTIRARAGSCGPDTPVPTCRTATRTAGLSPESRRPS
jgi:hypothetical protein